MISFNLIVGLLSGSLGTLIIKEFINQLNKRQDFVRELKKATYLKKLERAEKAVAFIWTYNSKIIEVKKSLEILIKAINELDEKDNDLNYIQHILEENGKALIQLAGEKYLEINSVHLYFDLDDQNKWNEQDLETLIKSMSEARSNDQSIKIWMDFYKSNNDMGDKVRAQLCWNEAIKLLPTYVDSLQNVINIIEKNRIASLGMIKAIKNQLKLY